MNRLDQLFKKLNFSEENGLFFLNRSEEWRDKFPFRVSKILKDVIQPYAFFCIYAGEQTEDNHPMPLNQSFILFFDNPTNEQEERIHSQVINFGLSTAVFINRPHTIDFFEGNNFNLESIKRLKKVKNSSSVEDFNELSFTNIISGKYSSQQGQRIDHFLLNNITDARNLLISNAPHSKRLNPKIANRLIGRMLFVRYLIDRNVSFSDQNYLLGNNKLERRKSFNKLISKKTSLYRFFKYLNGKYNGDLFPLIEVDSNGKIIYNEEPAVETRHLEVLYNLFTCSEFFSTGKQLNGYFIQQSLFDLYDFEIIPVELISNIYESFIGGRSAIDNNLKTKQKKVKAYYTPAYLVDFVLSQTVTPFLADPDNHSSDCKVLDPACGSGIFLVETARKIIEKELALTKKKQLTDHKLWKLIKSNIFGIDIDPDAIDISVFSLYVTILDYKDPAEIEKFKFQKLKDENLFGGPAADFFNITHPFNTKIVELDFIIGNPPWGQVDASDYVNYIKKREQKEFNEAQEKSEEYIPLSIGDKEICQAFMLRVSDFKADRPLKCSFIVSSKVLYNTELTARKFRDYFLNNFLIKQVVELSPVNNKLRGGNHIFDNARQPAAIITYIPRSLNEDTGSNLIQHITIRPSRLFLKNKTIVIHKNDVKEINQGYLMQSHGGDDWLWKVLVHGNILDIHFLRRLKGMYVKASDLLVENHFKSKGGIKLVDGDKGDDVTDLLSFDYLDAENGFRPFQINATEKLRSVLYRKGIKKAIVGYVPEKKYFIGEKLLMKKGIVLMPQSTEHLFSAVTAYTNKKICFSSTICSIIPTKKTTVDAKRILTMLTGLFNSKLFTYYLLHSSSSAGIERSRVHFSELLSFPVIRDSQKISDLALQISGEYLKDTFFTNSESFIKGLKEQLENTIAENYNLSDIEKSLIDFAVSISIPSLLREKDATFFKHLEFKNKPDYDYIVDYFYSIRQILERKFKKAGKYLVAKVIYTDLYVRINVYPIASDQTRETLVVEKSGVDDWNVLAGDLGLYSVCKNLYIQQDFRGFSEDHFYIIKPNERRLFHKSVGYLDALEFKDKLVRAEINLTVQEAS